MVIVARGALASYQIVAPFAPGGRRSGLHLTLEDRAGRRGVGDAAPLLGFCDESLAEVEAALKTALNATALLQQELESLDDIAACLSAVALPPSGACALEQSLIALLAAERELTPCELLVATPREEIRLSELVDGPEQARRSSAACLKLKVGRLSLDEDQARVAAVRRVVGDRRRLRLDANGRWSSAQAEAALRRLAPYGIECVEQPVAELEAMASLRKRCEVCLAVDEAVRDQASLERAIALSAADILVLKPMFCGGVLASLALARRATAAGLSLIVTTSLESAVGRGHALTLAACAPEPLLPCGLQLPGRAVRPPSSQAARRRSRS